MASLSLSVLGSAEGREGCLGSLGPRDTMTQKEGGGHHAGLSHPLRREGRGGEGTERQRDGGHGVGDGERDRGTPPGSGHALSQASVGLSWQNNLKFIVLLVVGMG